MSIVGILLTSIIVPATLNFLTQKIEDNKKGDIYNFDMRPAKQIAYLGLLFLGFIAIIILLPMALYIIEGIDYHKITNQLTGFVFYLYLFFILFGLFATLAPVKGFWENSIRNNEIIVSRFWIFKKKIKFSDIAYCQPRRGGIDVFLKDKKKKAFSVDSMSTNMSLWFKRLRTEGIKTNKTSEKSMEFYQLNK